MIGLPSSPYAGMTAELFHPTYRPGKENAWHLSVWLAPGLQAWCVHEKDTGRVVALAAHPHDHLPHPDKLPALPANASFTAMPETSTLVPSGVLEPGQEMLHLKLVHGKVPTGLLRDEPLAQPDAHCLYLHDEQAERQLLGRYPAARSLPLHGTLIHMAMHRAANDTVAVLHRTENRLDVVLAAENRLLLSNSFFASTPEDLLYYTLFAVEQCQLVPSQVCLYMGGTHLLATDELLFSNYFTRGPEPSTDPEGTAAGYLKIPEAHHWSGLIEQFPCAS